MAKKSDKDLVLEVYELYVSSETYSDYNDSLKELSLQTNKTIKYLKDLLGEYKNIFSKDQQKKIIDTKKKHLEARKNNNYQNVVDKLSKMSLEELRDYLSTKSFSDVKVSFNKFFDKTDDQDSLKVARDTLDKIREIYDQWLQEKSFKKEQEDYRLAIELFDIMINDGLFDFVDFRRKYYSKYNMSEENFYYYIDKYRKFLIKKYPDKYAYYDKEINRNKMKYIYGHAFYIQDMLNRIPDNYDIVDFFVNINLPIDIFRRLCNEFLESEQIIKISMFLEKYVDLMNNNIRDAYSLAIPTYTVINDFVLTDEIKDQILMFMKEYNVPRNFFIVCVDKYKKGELDNYLKGNKKGPNI